jgi:hypothetical protein
VLFAAGSTGNTSIYAPATYNIIKTITINNNNNNNNNNTIKNKFDETVKRASSHLPSSITQMS